jgi:hypothetical protein
VLVIVGGSGERRFTAAELLARPDVADLRVSEAVLAHDFSLPRLSIREKWPEM